VLSDCLSFFVLLSFSAGWTSEEILTIEVNPIVDVSCTVKEPFLVVEPASITNVTNLCLLLCSGLLLKVLCVDFWGRSQIRKYQRRVLM